MPRPNKNDYAEYYHGYIQLIEGDDPVSILEKQMKTTQKFLQEIPADKERFKYAENKWSVKEVIGHMLDTEKVMYYRALCIARGENKSLPGFEQDEYVKEANFNCLDISDLIMDYRLTRQSSILLYKNFDEIILEKRGKADNKEVTVLALAFIIVGHEAHHIKVLKEKYLI